MPMLWCVSLLKNFLLCAQELEEQKLRRRSALQELRLQIFQVDHDSKMMSHKKCTSYNNNNNNDDDDNNKNNNNNNNNMWKRCCSSVKVTKQQ